MDLLAKIDQEMISISSITNPNENHKAQSSDLTEKNIVHPLEINVQHQCDNLKIECCSELYDLDRKLQLEDDKMIRENNEYMMGDCLFVSEPMTLKSEQDEEKIENEKMEDPLLENWAIENKEINIKDEDESREPEDNIPKYSKLESLQMKLKEMKEKVLKKRQEQQALRNPDNKTKTQLATERKRRQREKIRSDAELYERAKAYERERARIRKETGKLKSISEKTPEEQREQRIRWREANKRYCERKKRNSDSTEKKVVHPLEINVEHKCDNNLNIESCSELNDLNRKLQLEDDKMIKDNNEYMMVDCLFVSEPMSLKSEEDEETIENEKIEDPLLENWAIENKEINIKDEGESREPEDSTSTPKYSKLESLQIKLKEMKEKVLKKRQEQRALRNPDNITKTQIATERKRKQREKIRSDAELYERAKAYERERGRMRKKTGKLKSISEKTPDEQHEQRIRWREANKRYYERKKQKFVAKQVAKSSISPRERKKLLINF